MWKYVEIIEAMSREILFAMCIRYRTSAIVLFWLFFFFFFLPSPLLMHAMRPVYITLSYDNELRCN